MNTKRFARRAALRGFLAAGVAGAGAVAGRRRRWAGAAAAGGLVAGAALELPAAGAVAAAAVAAASVAAGRGTGAGHADRSTLAAATAGAAVAVATTRVWPVAPRTPVDIRPALTTIGTEPSEDGAGLTVVVNADAGSARPVLSQGPLDTLRAGLPQARVVEVTGDELDGALKEAANECRVIGIAGGDGSISAAAAVAHDAGRPLLVVPAGTLNHLARDLGLAGADDAVQAVRDGHAVAVDVATIDGRPFVNTASFGSYGELVDARERLESRIGKWPALCVALVRVLRRGTPVRVEIDGRERRLWMIFVGNCVYHPAGFAPSWRERLDDGRLDVRLVDATTPLARTRLLLAVLTGRLGRSRVYEAFTTRELRVRSLDGPLRLAHDGEVFDGSDEFVIRKEDRPLAVYVPRPDSS